MIFTSGGCLLYLRFSKVAFSHFITYIFYCNYRYKRSLENFGVKTKRPLESSLLHVLEFCLRAQGQLTVSDGTEKQPKILETTNKLKFP